MRYSLAIGLVSRGMLDSLCTPFFANSKAECDNTFMIVQQYNVAAARASALPKLMAA